MTDRTSSPSREGARRSTFPDRVSELVLKSCREQEPNAIISSVLRDSTGRTVVRVTSSSSSGNPITLLRALKRLWPLANTAVVDNPLDGSVEAEITVPREEDEFTQARTKARSSRFSEFSMLLGTVMLLVGAILYAIDVHNSRFDNSTAHSEL
tara:strand:- start:734 stop:1192 length:459 start_codon:yes stop_codon:yes gene_type:complete